MEREIKPLLFNEAAKRDYDKLPEAIQDDFGYDLYLVQKGRMPKGAKVLKGFGGADVLELCQDDRAGAYRAMYTVRFEEAIYVLHAFQKKSHKGIATDKQDMDKLKDRLKWAEAMHQDWVRKLKGG